MKLKTLLFSGYSAVFAFIILIGTISYNGLGSLVSTADWVEHTQEVISSARLIEKTIVDMETGQRGFLITGNEKFLEPYHQGVTTYLQTMNLLHGEVADNPAQQAKLIRIKALVNKWQEVAFQPEVDMRRQVDENAFNAEYLQTVLSKGLGKSILDDMRQIMDVMIDDFVLDGNVKGQGLIQAVAKSMVDQETGERGYLITGKDEFLDPFHAGKIDLAASIAALRQLITNAHDRIKVNNSLNNLTLLSKKWLKQAGLVEIELRRQVDAGKQHQKVLAKQLAAGEGKNILDQMRVYTDELMAMFVSAENSKAEAIVIQIAKNMVDQETGQRGFIITGKEEFLAPFHEGQQGFSAAILSLQRLNANAYNINSINNSLNKLERLAQQWLDKAATPEINARKKMNQSKISMNDVKALIELSTGKNIMDELRVELTEFINVEQALLQQRKIDSLAGYENNALTIIIITLLAVILGIGVMLYTIKELLVRIGGEPKEIAEITQRLAEGDIKFAMQVTTLGETTGIYAAVKELILVFSRKNNAAADQDWLKTGQNEINAQMRGIQDETILSRNLITFIAKYLGAQVGALYLKEDESNHLKLTGSYAFSKRKNVNDRIEIGEGLVGQAAYEQELISITNVPDDYTRIGSATGDAIPHNVVVSPFMINGVLSGVIELASFKEFSDIKIELLDSVKETLSINFHAAKTSSKVQALLEESQQQSEELENQSEELRASNEELEEKSESLSAQTEQLRLLNDDLKLQKVAISKKNEEVERKAEELAISSKYKSEFLANMSHELRTPLNSMLLLSNSLCKNKEGNLTAKQVQSATIVHQGGQDLLGLINEILDLSKIEAGMMDLELAPVAILDIVESIKRNFSHMMQEKKLDFIITTEDNVPSIIHTDQKRLEQILKNLLSNAIKFTNAGSISVNFSRPTSNDALSTIGLSPFNSLEIAVTDTGIGIAEDKQQLVFEAFQQVEGGTARKFGGTGLGLSISRELTKLLGGEIRLDSEIDKGSTFTFTLPLDRERRGKETGVVSDRTSGSNYRTRENAVTATVTATVETEVMQQSGMALLSVDYHVEDDRKLILEQAPLTTNKKIILVIEDDPYFAKILVDQGQDQGLLCIATATGEEGLILAEQIMPDAILLDINLPGIDGWSVLNTLKDNQKTRHIPVHIMSADDENKHGVNKGAIGFVSKPVSQEQLDVAFTTLIDLSNKSVKDLLIIEDDKSSLIAIEEVIGGGDVNITSAMSGKEGFNALLANNFDCVILDLKLTDMSGFELLEKLSLEKDLKIPPIIIYTGKDLSKEESHQLLKYSESIIIKGVDSEERLLDETALFLHRIIGKLPQHKQKIIHDLHDVEQVFKGKKILVVDDDIRNIFALSQTLEEKGIEVLAAENGKVALQLLNNNTGIDLVLMDIMMPVMDGYETTREIRKQEQFKKLPIIALTAKAMKEDRDKCIDAGASDYLTKPVDLQRLFSMLRIWMYS